METMEWKDETLDRSQWIAGPWDDEPDKMQFSDPATGLPCLIRRNRVGGLCGYVGVSEGHPWFGKPYMSEWDEEAETYHDLNVDVHGGLTYSDFCQETGNPAHGVCHIPAPGEPDRVWWLGFDCVHAGDYSPGLNMINSPKDRYRSIAYVQQQIVGLAAQIAAAA